MALDRSLRTLLYGLGAVVTLFLAVLLSWFLFSGFGETSTTVSLDENETEVIENTSAVVEEVSERDKILEEAYEEEIEDVSIIFDVDLSPDSIQRSSVRVTVDDIFLRDNGDGSYDLHVLTVSEDRIEDEELSKSNGNFVLRSPVQWSGYLYLYRGRILPLFLCDSGSDGRFWFNTYCTSISEIDRTYFGQKIRFIHTNEDFFTIQSEGSLAISKLDHSFVFDLTLPEEVYVEYN